MKIHSGIFPLALGAISLLSLLLFIYPWSLSTQTSSFSLALDLDDSAGDQAVSSLDVSPDQVVPIQIFGSDIQGASSLSARIEYDSTQVVYEGFDAGDVLPDAQVLVEQDSTSVRIGIASLSGSTVNTGLIGTVRFRTTDVFLETEVRLVRAELGRGEQSEAVALSLSVALQVAAPPSPDFDGSGLVGFPDFVLFAGAFGYREGGEKYGGKYDLNSDGRVGFDDFEIFAGSFGNTVNRAPVFTSTPVTRSVPENTPAGQAIGDPISARDADGNTLAYSLRGADADSFAIDAGTGQLRTQGAYDFEAQSSYSVIARVSDGEGARASLVVSITVTDIAEPPAALPPGVVVTPGDSALTVRWDAVSDEVGKPPVSGYEVALGQGENGKWQDGLIVDSRTDTSVTLTGLTNDQAYQVRVRTLNEEGTSAWSAPVSGTPVGGPAPVGVIPAQTLILGDGDVRVNAASAFTHPGEGTLTYGVASSDDAVATVSVSDSIVTIRPVAVGRATITVTANDGRWSATQEVAVAVLLTAPGICGRTPQVRAALLSLIPEVVDCALVTEAHLSAIRDTLYLRKQEITALKAGDFAGLSRLSVLRLGSNSLTALPRGIFSGLDSLRDLQLGANALSSLPGGVFSKLSNLQRLDLGGNALTVLPEGVFSDLSDLQILLLYVNKLHTLPEGIFAGLSSLQSLWLDRNPGAPFPLMLALKRTDTPDVFAPGPGRVRVTLPEGAPFNMSVRLSVTGGSLSHATIAVGSTTSTPISVTQRGDNVTVVSLGSVSGAPEGYRGIRTGVGGPLRLFVKPIEVVGSVDTQTLDPDGGEETVDVSGLFRAEATLTYEVSSSKPNVASVSISGSVVRITSNRPGRATITITAIDAQGNRVETTFRVVVTSPPPPPPPPQRPPPPPPPPPGQNQAPTFDDGPGTNRSVAENTAAGQNIQHPVRATDEDGHRLTYRLNGADADSFAINAGNGQLRTRSGVTYDYEMKVSYAVTVEADDGYGGDATIDVTIHVADVDEPPEAPARPGVQPASSTSLTVTWTAPVNTGPDIDGYDVQYRTGSGSFLPWPHGGSGTTATITDLDVNTRYEVQVRATNDEGTGAWSSSGYGATSTNQPPVFDETAPTRSLTENTTGVQDIGDPISATDPENTALTYRLAGGDTDQFTIDSSNGQLRTQTGVDYNYEVRNRYSVRVEAADEQGGRATIAVTIEVTDDDNERPDTPDRPTVTASTLTSLTIRWTEPTNTGPPITDYNVQYREGSSGAFTAVAHDGTGTTTTIANLKSDTPYQIQVQATSDEGTSEWSPSGNGRTVANQAPTFTEGSSTTRRLAENTTGTHDIGNPVTATDSDGGTLNYSLEGTDQASFAINGNQLRTRAGVTYDYEEKSSYEVTVRVEDGQGGSNTIAVTINLTDEQEPPEAPAAPRVIPASSTSLTVTWTEPTNTGPDIDDYDIQYREGDSGSFTSWTHNSADRTATITGRSPGTSYEVQVRARNAEGTSDWSPSGTGSTGANGRPVFTDGSSATRPLDENTTGVQNIDDPVGATDPENTTLTYSLEGTDADAFTINSRNGQLRTKSDQTYDYETKPRYVLSIKATDGHGGSSTILVLINLNDVNEPPAFTSDATFETVENGTRVGAVIARDEDSADGITGYTLTGGADRDLFGIDSGGALTFKDAPDFEDPADNGRNNSYIVVVTATGGTGGRALTAEQTITVTVTDVNEPPRFTSDNSLQVKENERFVGRMVAEDVDSDDHITGYEVTGRVDRNRFEITNTNELHFKEDPDRERPADVGSNNQYIVAVTATGGTGTRERRTEQRIFVIVEDVLEPPGKPDPPTVSDETENNLTVTWTEPANTGPDIANYHVQYRISGTFTDWPDTGPSRTRTITGLRSGRTYQIQVQAENDEGKGAWSNSVNGTTLTAPTVSSVAFTSTPASGQNNTYRLNDVIDVTVTFNGAVTVTGTPQIDLTIGSTVRQADYQSGSTTTQLLFQYTVQAGDEDVDGATINANSLKLNGGGIRKNNSTINADLAHGAQTNQSGHKVDGVAPALTEAEVEGDELALLYGEALDSSSQPATGDFAVTVDSEARSVSAVAVSSSEVTLTLASAVTSGQAVTLTYTPGTNPIRDRALNPAIALTNLTVANQTQDPTINICNRTAQVRDAIVAAAPVSTCGAVTADHLSAITVLDLDGKGASTLKAGDFSGLTALETLHLSFYRLSSLPQNIFSGLSALEELKLSYSQLSSLNDADIFSSLSALKRLDLRGNGLRSLDANIFSSLSALEVLHLGDLNRLSSLDADIFSNLSALEELYLNDNDLTSLDANLFSNLSALKTLYLNDNDLTSLDANLFSNLSALKTLWLQRNDLSTVASGAFSGLTALETLHLQENDFTSLDANLFSNLSALTTLYLEENDLGTVASGAFSGLSALKTLWLQKNDLQPTSLPAGVFSSLTALETLRLDDNQLSSLPANFFSGLSALQELYLTGQQSGHRLNSLDANTFSGLAELTRLHLNDNNLSSLPDGVFSGMTELEALILAGNTVDPLPITVSLESLASGLFRAKAHTGAPFEMTLPLQVVNGTIGSGAGSIEIPQGSIQSAILTVSRTAGTTATVTVDIGTLPDLPSYDNGYALVKSTDLPLEVIEGLPGVTVYPTALTIPEGNSDTYIVVLQLQPTEDVTVAVTVPSGSDASVNPASLTFTADNWDDSQTLTVTTQADVDDADDTVTLSHTVSGGNYQGVTAENVTVTIAEVDVSANNRPVFTSDDIFDKKENETEVGTVVATDADARDPITGYEITGGAAQAQFSITSGGVLTFVTAPDYERPPATASNNRYVIVVTASSGAGSRERTATQPITVNVDDVDEPPGQPPAPILTVFDSGFQPVVLVHEGRTPPTNTGPDITAWDVQYRVKNSGAFTATILNKPPDWVQEITGLLRNTTYEVRLRAKNDEGESEWSPSSKATIPNASPIASGSIDDLTMPAGGAVAVVAVDDAFDDPDDLRLRYTATSSNGAIATVRMIGGVVLIDPLSAGTATITATAADPWGATASTSFDATVQTPTLAAPTLSISGNVFSFGFTDDFAANETRYYEVRIRQKSPIGQWSRACIRATNRADFSQNSAASLDILASSFFEPGATYEADYGYLGADCGGSVVGVRSAPAEATTAGTPSFDIDLVFVGSISSRYQLAVENAARRWEQIITHDVPNHSLSDNARIFLNELYPENTAPDNVDDLLIYVKIAPIDGAGGTLAQAGSDVWRISSALPIVSYIELDASDLDTMSDRLLAAVMLHEIGHTLGYGIEPWTDHNLLQNPSLDAYSNRIVPAPDTHFSGANAIAAFNAAGGTSYTGAKAPVENRLGGSGSRDAHWREFILDEELMTPRISDRVAQPLSAITIQAMADIGYRVDVTQADAYVVPDASTRVARATAGDSVPISCAIVTRPGAGPDRPEPIVLQVKRTGESE